MHWVKAMELEYAELALRIRLGRCVMSVGANCGFTPVGYLVNQGCFVINALSPKEGFSHPSQISTVNLGQECENRPTVVHVMPVGFVDKFK
jgi:hypothetical protein